MDKSSIEQLLGETLIASNTLKIMVVDTEMNIVWHNQAHGALFTGTDLVGKKCYETLGSEDIHQGCPTCIALSTGKPVQGLYDFGTTNCLIISMPLNDEYVAKIMLDVPKEANGNTIICE